MTTPHTIVLGGGCFWCTEAVFVKVRGITDVESGYSNGHVKGPTYEQVCTGTTGHNEVVKLEYDASDITLHEILEIFFLIHDPTTLNRQGNDVGTQYRSGIYVFDDGQRELAERSRDRFQEVLTGAGLGRITTEIEDAGPFYYAEPHHQQYLHKVPNGYCGLGGTGLSCPIGVAAAE